VGRSQRKALGRLLRDHSYIVGRRAWSGSTPSPTALDANVFSVARPREHSLADFSNLTSHTTDTTLYCNLGLDHRIRGLMKKPLSVEIDANLS